MKGSGNKRNKFASNNTSKKYQKETEGHGEGDIEIVEVSVTVRMDTMPFVNVTAVKVCIFNLIDYHQADWFVKIEKTEYPANSLRVVSLSYMNVLRT